MYRSRTRAFLAVAAALLFVSRVSVADSPIRPSVAPSVASASSSVLTTVAARTLAEREITPAQLRDYLTFIASDELEGRDTPSRGLDTAARFMATLLSRWGVRPMGDNGTYFQNITLSRSRIDAGKSNAALNEKPLRYGDDFVVRGGSGTAGGALVYVGHGWKIPGRGIDAYKGVDVKGKVLVISAARFPQGVTFATLRGLEAGKDWMNAEMSAAQSGAAGIIRLPSGAEPQRWEQARQFAQRMEQRAGWSVEKLAEGDARENLPSITLSPAAVRTLFAGEKKLTADEALKSSTTGVSVAAFDLNPAKRITLTVARETERTVSRNVVAAVEGSDPTLKAEYVALGAHYDHVGVNQPNADGDRIFNGADDDGSGTVALLAIAEALSKSPEAARPKRSTLFVWHMGEEHGLWGSDYFTRFPTVPLSQIVSQVNIDMIGRSKPANDTKKENEELSGPNEVYVIGSKMMSTELGDLTERVNREYLNLSYNYRYDDPKDPNGFFFRSDHFHYARKGIPILFFFDGVHEDYHGRDDEPDRIDYEKLARVTRTIFLTVVEISNRDSRPVVDKKLPFRNDELEDGE